MCRKKTQTPLHQRSVEKDLLTMVVSEKNGTYRWLKRWLMPPTDSAKRCWPRNYAGTIRREVRPQLLKKPLATSGGTLGFHGTLVENCRFRMSL